MSKNILLRKLNTYSAWLLFLLVFLYFISGYGMTKNIIDKEVATLIHEKYLPVPTIVLFVVHGGLGARILLKRAGLSSDKVIRYVTLLIFITVFLTLLYFESS